ncbi:peptide-methionine (S)-S-oxide reductase [Cognatishimia sp. MH4019]|uniref:peptide-methionine (S)-S-oxide reductase n=1 Tax=Cognatishimia sp. MH4019 TaxID=2854030 RepID=UPI001CD801F8
MRQPQERIGLGGGCHWCTEAVFQALAGVSSVTQGFIASAPPDDSYSEAVDLMFDPQVLPLEALLEVHLRTHASQSNHKMRGKYRSAVYVHSDAQAMVVATALAGLQEGFEAPLVTRVLPFRAFIPSEPRYQDYAARYRGGPFCERYIDPKLDMLRKEYVALLRSA